MVRVTGQRVLPTNLGFDHRMSPRRPGSDRPASPGARRARHAQIEKRSPSRLSDLAVHDGSPVAGRSAPRVCGSQRSDCCRRRGMSGQIATSGTWSLRSEEHTSELQSQSNIVCRLLLEKKKKKTEIDNKGKKKNKGGNKKKEKRRK